MTVEMEEQVGGLFAPLPLPVVAELWLQVADVSELVGADAGAAELVRAVAGLEGADVLALLKASDALVRSADRVRTVATGVIASRSGRDAGHSGLAQSHGHRNAVALVQEATGASRAEAAKQVRVGEALIEAARQASDAGDEALPDGGSCDGADAGMPGPEGEGEDGAGERVGGAGVGADRADDLGSVGAGADGADDVSAGVDPESADEAGRAARSWRTWLSEALLHGKLTRDQHHAILRGLGEPPEPETVDPADADAVAWAAARAQAAREAWAVAAQQLIEEAKYRTVEELGQQARMIRDRLDPEGAARRFEARYNNRGFRTWTDADGGKHGRIDFDDESYLWWQSVFDSALRPRRGGPRFVDPDEKKSAEQLASDTRTNDQLAYDLLMDVFRAGTLAEPKDVFGTRQAGVRIVHVMGPDGAPAGVAHSEDGLHSFPSDVADRRVCDTGTVSVTVDSCGNPLDVGREQRLYMPRQRVALAARDGGCLWRGCDRPASYCEAHHIDPWATEGGRTDVDRGILLCRFHHMELHHGGWRITREGKDEFMLHPPGGGEAITLHRRLALQYAWAGIDPPPKRFRGSG